MKRGKREGKGRKDWEKEKESEGTYRADSRLKRLCIYIRGVGGGMDCSIGERREGGGSREGRKGKRRRSGGEEGYRG